MLTGQTVLVVEEELLIALDIQRVLESFNVGETTLAHSVGEALALQDHWSSCALAIIDLKRAAPDELALCEALRNAGVPLVFTTADYITARGVPGMHDVAVVLKPVPEQKLTSAIAGALARRT
jgi:CheY-like chemotaxis protein